MKSRDFGEIAFWNGNSFGFIKPDRGDSGDLFFHVSELPEGQHDVHRGDRVQYDVDRDRYKPDKMRAVRVSFINGEAK